jgi:AmmeMemoRadiSam system protein A
MSQHAFPCLARAAVDRFVRKGEVLESPQPLPVEMQTRAGVFVSIHLLDGRLRGCIGTIQPLEDNIAREIVRNAIAAASRDPRFEPIRTAELPSLDYSVDVLSEAEKVDGVDELDPKRYGIIVEQGRRRGLLLPALEGVDDAATQLALTLDKAGIHPAEEFQLYRFEVKRYH